MSKAKVDPYFATLKDQEDLLEFPKGSKIWNMDESGFNLEHNPQKVVTRKGAKAVPRRVGCNRENISVIACGNAEGYAMPPMIIVKGKTHKSLWAYSTDEGPTGALWTWQERAWTEDLLGQLWFKDIFLKYWGPERPQLLILDQHHSHEVT